MNIKIPNKNSIQFSSYVFNFYCVFCSFGYYTFLIPYRFVLVENGYEICTNKIRQASNIYIEITINAIAHKCLGGMLVCTFLYSGFGSRNFTKEILSTQDRRQTESILYYGGRTMLILLHLGFYSHGHERIW